MADPKWAHMEDADKVHMHSAVFKHLFEQLRSLRALQIRETSLGQYYPVQGFRWPSQPCQPTQLPDSWLPFVLKLPSAASLTELDLSCGRFSNSSMVEEMSSALRGLQNLSKLLLPISMYHIDPAIYLADKLFMAPFKSLTHLRMFVKLTPASQRLASWDVASHFPSLRVLEVLVTPDSIMEFTKLLSKATSLRKLSLCLSTWENRREAADAAIVSASAPGTSGGGEERYHDAPEWVGTHTLRLQFRPLRIEDCPSLEFLQPLTKLEVLSLEQVSHPGRMQADVVWLSYLKGLTKLRLTDRLRDWSDQRSQRKWYLLQPLTALVRLAELHVGGTWHFHRQTRWRVVRNLRRNLIAEFKAALSRAKREGGYCDVKYVYGDEDTGSFTLKGKSNIFTFKRFSAWDHSNLKVL